MLNFGKPKARFGLVLKAKSLAWLGSPFLKKAWLGSARLIKKLGLACQKVGLDPTLITALRFLHENFCQIFCPQIIRSYFQGFKTQALYSLTIASLRGGLFFFFWQLENYILFEPFSGSSFSLSNNFQ